MGNHAMLEQGKQSGDGMTPPIKTTPAFLAWAIEHRCLPRGSEDGRDPQRVERQLRAARAVGEARQQGWYVPDPASGDPGRGLVVRPGPTGPQGFWVAEALSLYGALRDVEAACQACPMHVTRHQHPATLAGCYGELPFPEPHDPWHAALEAAVEKLGCRPLLARLRRPTRPIWYGLWCDSPLAGPALSLVADVLEAMAGGPGHAAPGQERPASMLAASANAPTEMFSKNPVLGAWSWLVAALRVAYQQGARVHVQLHPPGRVEGRRWLLPAHCPRCSVPWPPSRLGSAARAGRCPVCDDVGPPAPARRRCARGQRPYQPLERLLRPSVR
jgi:hypothetical protein